MSNLTVFQFNTNQVRVIDIEGKPWFVLSDVLQAISNAKRGLPLYRQVSGEMNFCQ